MRTQKLSAFVLLFTFSIQTFWPGVSYALTSGPSTPEMKAFEPATTSDMVDLFSGDFSYNIPLMDVGGYPVNLSYHAGAHPEEEASWVGFGWSLNPGAINRQLRGLPDDFNGDRIQQIDNKKPNKTYSASINFTRKRKGKRKGRVKYNLHLSYNNYTGYSANLGVPLYSFNITKQISSSKTQNLNDNGKTKSLNFFGGAGLNSSSNGGVSPYGSFEVNYKTVTQKEREAEKSLDKAKEEYERTLASSADKAELLRDRLDDKVEAVERSRTQSNYSASVNFERFQPPGILDIKMKTTDIGGSLTFGPKLFKHYKGFRIDGTYVKQRIESNMQEAAAFGFPNSVNGKDDNTALLDYNIEKDNAYCKELPNLGVPVFNNDLFSVTSNAGSMQFRSFLRGSGIFNKRKITEGKFDPLSFVDLKNIGIEIGVGNLFHIGVPIQFNLNNNESGKWTSRNDFLGAGDFKNTQAGHLENRSFSLRRIGEQVKQDNNYFSRIGGTSPIAVKLSRGPASWAWGHSKAEAECRTKTDDISAANSEDLSKTEQAKANNSITYLTNAEAALYALDQSILDYPSTDVSAIITNKLQLLQPANRISRTSDYRAKHHISQYTITQDNGQRMVYGIPVYNTKQEEASFSISYQKNQLGRGFATYNPNVDNTIRNNKGRDYYFHKYITPAYTTGHLLSAILSPDYVDVTGDGVSDDDLGSAVKFNYSKLSNLYTWRTPHVNLNGTTANTANYNEGLKSIYDDDKGNYTWGKKEIWNLQSIESKTMVAIFYTKERNDALGAIDENGGIQSNIKLKRLEKIELYTKSELNAHPTDPTPIKTVHFKYDDTYSLLMSGLPNTLSNRGKLVLKSVYFTYGKNNKGENHKYEFGYKKPSGSYANCNNYQEYQSDRWGTYKDKSRNPAGMDNFEYPYSTQNKTDANEYASFWQLNKIELPSGAIINVDYESDEYAYVQDRKAAEMCKVIGIGNENAPIGANTDFSEAEYLLVELPAKINSQEKLESYLGELKYISFKGLVNLFTSEQEHYEYVNGYAEIIKSGCKMKPGDATKAYIKINKLNGYNPIAKAAWQKLKLEMPKLAYSNFGEPTNEPDFMQAMQALGEAIVNIKELTRNFDRMCIGKGFGNTINLSKSWVRLPTPIGLEESTSNRIVTGKLGGGLRVKRITIDDQWATMSGVTGAKSSTYGQEYDYTTTKKNSNGEDEVISSGVASYEPSNGSDENPFKEPINYETKTFFTQPKYFYLERPMGESYFPGASVGYSKVTVRNIGADNEVGANGSTVSEFYTAKDFPTKVSELQIDKRRPRLPLNIKLWGATMPKTVAVSQGYAVENNNMHGKQKTETVYGKSGIISSAKYNYKVNDPKAEKLELNNNVPTVKYVNGVMEVDKSTSTIVGMDIDMFSEMNQAKTENMGVSLDPSASVWLVPKIPPFRGHFSFGALRANWEKRLYRSSTTIKLINRFAILESVEKTVNGSYSKTTNMLWDEETGEVLLTKTNNEFDKDVYSFSYPAHWFYNGMGPAYKNEGIFIENFTTEDNTVTGVPGRIKNSFNQYLVEGDEIIDLSSNAKNKYWVIKPNSSVNEFYLIDKDGKLVKNLNTNVKIMRSGRRNLAEASVGSVITMTNPMYMDEITGKTRLEFNRITVNRRGTTLELYNPKVLQAKAIEYNNEWQVPVADEQVWENYTPTPCTNGGRYVSRENTNAVYDTIINAVVNKNGKVEHKTEIIENKRNVLAARTVSNSCICNCLKKLFDYLLADPSQNLLFAYTNPTQKTVRQIAADAGIIIGSNNSCPLLDDNADKPFYALTNINPSNVYKAKIGDCIISLNSNNGSLLNFYELKSLPCNTGDNLNFHVRNKVITQDIQLMCTHTEITLSPGGVSEVFNDDKIRIGAKNEPGATISNPNFYVRTNFYFKDLFNKVPSNTNLISAKLYLFHTSSNSGFAIGGYNSNHSLNSTLNLTNPIFYAAFHSGKLDANGVLTCNTDLCSQTLLNPNYWGATIATFPIIPMATSQNQDIIADFTNEITQILSSPIYQTPREYQQIRFSCPPIGSSDSYLGYATFASENDANVNLHPFLRVVYDDPNIIADATLQIESCSKSKCQTTTTINPYTKGLLGNWRAKKEWLYDTKRVKNKVNPANANSTDLRNSGYFAEFNPFWGQGSSLKNWQWRSQANKFNLKGEEVENVDPLGRYNAAQYGYLQSVPVAVGSNARYREIGYDGFEDYNFNLGKGNAAPSKCDIQDHFSFKQALSAGKVELDNTLAHSGNTSLKIIAGNTASITKPTLLNEPAQIHTVVNNEYQIDANNHGNYLRFGFMPNPSTTTTNQKYILSGWVYDGNKTTNAISNNFTIKINNATYNANDATVNSKVYMVEGWKRFEIVFNMPTQANPTDLPDVSIEFGATVSNINIDDIRVHPYTAQLKSFAYDANSMRLMAELDENNFATFYEYDDEGTLIRVKKETEKGINTIKETRSSIRKK